MRHFRQITLNPITKYLTDASEKFSESNSLSAVSSQTTLRIILALQIFSLIWIRWHFLVTLWLNTASTRPAGASHGVHFFIPSISHLTPASACRWLLWFAGFHYLICH